MATMMANKIFFLAKALNAYARLGLPAIAFFLALVVLSSPCTGQGCLAQQAGAREPEAKFFESAGEYFPAPPLIFRHAIKSKPNKLEVYQYDDSPLAGRTPLLLVHGLRGEFHPIFRWGQLAKHSNNNAAFRRRYKIYLARYNSHSTLKEMTAVFRCGLRDLPFQKPVTIIAISMPCMAVRDAMKDPEVDQSVSRVLCLGAFFRGSPLFCSDWMHKTIAQRHLSPLCRLDRNLAYDLYFSSHKSLLQDYRWDNSDGQMPAEEKLSRRREDSGVSCALTPKQSTNEDAQYQSDRKFIVYAAYLHNQFTPRCRRPVTAFLLSPLTFLRTTLPAHFTFERPALRFLNYLIASAIPADGDKSKIIYPFNDGISPITSSLLLQDDFVGCSSLRTSEDLLKIRGHSNARTARLFPNADHLTFIEMHRPLGLSDNLPDVLSADEKPRTIFEWILKDLLE